MLASKLFVEMSVDMSVDNRYIRTITYMYILLIKRCYCTVLFTIYASLTSVRCFELNHIIQIIFSPFFMGVDSIIGIVVYTLLVTLLWTIGIHGDNALAGIATPVFLANLAENTAAFQAGEVPPHIVVDNFWIVYLCLGGTGATIGLVLNMLRSKSKHFRSLGKLSIGPALFSINEPVIFGFPIVLNPVMMIPFILTPIISGVIAYILTDLKIIAPIVFQIPWTSPPVIGAYLATNGDIKASLLQIALIGLSYLIYRPFFIAEENKEMGKVKKQYK